jgi:hypothetical protein
MDDESDDWTDLIRRDDLKRELPLDSYIEEQLNELVSYNSPSPSYIAETRQRLEAFVRKAEKHAQPGDSWWEWVQGTVPQMQTGGLAVVRNGKIVWATMTWIS